MRGEWENEKHLITCFETRTRNGKLIPKKKKKNYSHENSRHSLRQRDEADGRQGGDFWTRQLRRSLTATTFVKREAGKAETYKKDLKKLEKKSKNMKERGSET